MKKRFLSLLMAAVMLLSLCPVTAGANEEFPEEPAAELTEPVNEAPAEETQEELPAEETQEETAEEAPAEVPAEDEAVAAVLARIAALPDPADFPTMTKGELQAVLDEANAIFDLYDALTKEQQKQIDLAPVRAMYEAEDYLGSAPAANGTTEFGGAVIDCGDGTPTTAENGDLILSYTTAGTDTLTIPEGYKAIATILAVGGGGAGGGGYNSTYGGSGGNGGEVQEGEYILDAGKYTIAVGGGGTGGTSRNKGNAGSNTQVTGTDFSITANGGDGGAAGKGSAPSSGSPTAGTESSITGQTYGQGGSAGTSSTKATDAAANTGNGGQGGAKNSNTDKRKGGAGGSGIVVIRITKLVPFHNHSFTYEGNIGSIYAHCTDPNCPSGYNSSISLKLSLNEAGYVSDAEMDMWRLQEAAEPVLTYFAASDLSDPLPGAPTEEGDYVVTLTVGGATAQRSYTKKLHVYDVDGVPTEFSPWEDRSTIPTETGNYYLQGVVTLTADVTITGKVNLAMNKFAIVKNKFKITLADGAELNFYGADPTPYATGIVNSDPNWKGYDGKTIKSDLWYLLEGTTLTIGGIGSYDRNVAMLLHEYPWIEGYPSATYSTVSKIEHLVLNEGVAELPLCWNDNPDSSKSAFPVLKDITIKSKNFSATFANQTAYLPNLTTVTFAEGVQTVNFVQASTFTKCTNLKTVILPSTLKEFHVHSQTFAGDTAFTTLTLDVNNPYFTCENNVLYNKDKTELVFAPPGVSTFKPAETVQVIRAGNNADMAALLKNQQINSNIQIELVHNKDGKALSDSDSSADVSKRKNFYVGELIKAKVTTKDGSPLPKGLCYAWLGLTEKSGKYYIDNDNTAKVAGFESPDMFYDGAEYQLSPDAYYGAVKITYFDYNSSSKDYLGTAYGRFAVCQEIDGQIKIVQYKDFTAKATSSSSYTYNNSMKYLAYDNTVTMLEGEEKDLRELLGRCGITHMTCNAVQTKNGRILSGADLIACEDGKDGENLTVKVKAKKAGTGAQLGFTIVCNNCLYHSKGQSDTGSLFVNMVKRPTVETTCSGAVLSDLPEGYAYYIGEQKYEPDTDGEIKLTGLTPGVIYTLNMRKIDPENGVTLYTLSTDFITVDHDYSDIRDNGDGTHSTYCQYGCGKYVDTAAHTFVSGECTVCHAKDHTHAFSYKASGTDIIASCTNVDCDLPEGKVTLTLTAEGGTYDGTTAFPATVTNLDAFVTTTGATVGSIEYYKGGAKQNGAPTDAGNYTAKVTVTYDTDKTVTAVKNFTVEKAEQTITASATQLFTYGDTGKVVSAKATGALSFAVKSGESVTVSAVGALTISKVGDTTVTITAAETDNYKAATKDVTVTVAAKEIEVPTAEVGLSYTGETQTGVKEGEGYTLVNNSATDAGDYTATATPKENYAWVGGTQEPAEIIWEIAQVPYTGEMTAEGKINAKKDSTVDITLPDLPDGAAYSATVTPDNANVSGSVSGTTLSLKVNTELAKDTTDFTVTLSVTGAKNYEDYEVTVTVEPVFHTHSFTYEASGTDIIASCTNVDCDLPGGKITLTLTADDAPYTGEAYDGASHNDGTVKFASTTGATVGKIEYQTGSVNASTGAVTWNAASETAPKEVGNYKAIVTVTAGDTPYTAEKEFSITMATPTVTTLPTASAITYGQTLNDSTLTNGAASVAGTFAWTTKTTAPAVSDSEKTEYEVTFTPNDTTHYNTTTCKITLTVNKAVGAVTAPTAKNALVYTGLDQALVTAGSSTTGTVKYAVTGKTVTTAPAADWSDTIPTGKDAGIYRVWYKSVGDKNHEDTTPAYVPVTVAPRPVTLVAGSANKVYDGYPLTCTTFTVKEDKTTPNYGFVNDEGVSSVAMTPESAISDVGTATNVIDKENITAKSGTKLSNYEITTENGILTVTPASMTVTATGYEGFYDGVEHLFEIKEGDKVTLGGISYVVTNAAGEEITDATITIREKGKEDWLPVTNFAPYKDCFRENSETKQPEPIDLTLEIKAEKTGFAVATCETTIKIKPRPVTLVAGSAEQVYNGKPLTCNDFAVKEDTTTAGYGFIKDEGVASVTMTEGITITNVGSVDNVIDKSKITAKDGTTLSNYDISTENGTLTVNKADGAVAAPTAKELTYNGQDQMLVDAGTSTTGEVQYKLGTDGKYSTGIPKAKAAGDYTVYYKVVGDSNHEDVAESSVIVTIAKATYDMTGVTFTPAANVYDGAAHHPTITGTLPTGADGVQVTVTYSGSQTNVGETDVTATFATTSGNYNTPASMTAKQTVVAKPVTLTWGMSKFTYDGSEKTVSVTVEGLVSGETCTATLTGNSAANAGDYTAEVISLSNSNYKLPDDVEKTWKIGKAAQDAPARGEGYTISGTTLTAQSGYELYNGSDVKNAFTMATGESYSVRKTGDSNHFASPYTAIDTKVTVSVLAVPGNMGTVTGGGSYDIGSDVTVTATARRGYEFVEWQDMSGTQVGTTASYTIKGITAGQTLIAAFKPKDKVMAALPAVTQDRTYTGSEITGLSGGSGWTLVRGDLIGINAGDYSAVIKLADGYDVWPDGTTADKTVGWNIFKDSQPAPEVTAGENTLTVQPAEGKTAEYRKQGESDYTTVSGTVEATPGTYYVRYRETENYYASPITVVVVSEPTLNVVTLQPSDLSNTGVTFNGVVAPYDAEKVSEVGFEYVSIDKNGIVSASASVSTTKDQTFSAQVNDLTEDTDYQVRAYVKRGNTTTYGSLVAFHTPKAAPVAQDNGKIKVNATVEGASAKLIVSIERGNDVIASKQSDSATNSYTASFKNLPYGNYNVVVRTNNGHYTETKLLSIVDDNEVTVNFTVPAGKLAAIVEVKTPDTPKTAVDGLGEVLTKEDKDAAANGSKDVEVKLEVEKKAESNAAGAEEIKELLSENDQILFLDMSLLKTTTELDEVGNATSIDTENIGATNDKVMEIAVPYGDTAKAPKVLRYHNGMAESLTELDARPTAPFMDGTYFVDEGYVFIYASGFSTYAISYAQSTSQGGRGGNTNVISAPTGDAGLALYAALSVSSLLGMGWVGKKKRDEE